MGKILKKMRHQMNERLARLNVFLPALRTVLFFNYRMAIETGFIFANYAGHQRRISRKNNRMCSHERSAARGLYATPVDGSLPALVSVKEWTAWL